jgi:signal transduction histidine kinase
VRGDEKRLRQVLLNLLSNAVKFTPRGSVRLRVRGSEADGESRLRFEVTDTGIGIPDSAKDRLFKEFSQADASINRRFGGTGLGLPSPSD